MIVGPLIGLVVFATLWYSEFLHRLSWKRVHRRAIRTRNESDDPSVNKTPPTLDTVRTINRIVSSLAILMLIVMIVDMLNGKA